MQGIYTAVVTPFTPKNELDFPAFKRILDLQKSSGIAGVVVCGSTGESATLTQDEKKSLILFAKKELQGSNVKVIAGTGTNDTAKSVEFSKWADEQGVDGILLISPYYNKPTQAGIELHFKSIADAVRCEVILYNHPFRTGVSIEPTTLARLAEHPRIRCIKDSSANPALISEMVDALSEKKVKMDILSGDDSYFLPYLSLGAVGIISVTTNLLPAEFVKLYSLVQSNQLTEATKLHQKLHPLMRDLFIETNPVGIKWAMEYAGYCSSRTRLPLVQASPKATVPLEATLKKLGVSQRKYHD